MTNLKYKLTTETHPNNPTLRRIRYLRDIPRYDIKAGDLGGWLESEMNLSQDGDCVVLENAHVSGNARVSGNAQVFGNARVYGDAWVSSPFLALLQIQGSKHYLTAMLNNTVEDSFVQIGCQKLTLAEWLKKAKKIGEENGYTEEQVAEYIRYLKLCKSMLPKAKEEDK